MWLWSKVLPAFSLSAEALALFWFCPQVTAMSAGLHWSPSQYFHLVLSARQGTSESYLWVVPITDNEQHLICEKSRFHVVDNQWETKIIFIIHFEMVNWLSNITSKDSPFIDDGVCTPLASIMNIQQTTKTVFVDFTPIMLFTSWVVRPEIFWPHFGCSSVGLKCNGPRTAAICEHCSLSKWNQNG